MRGYHGCGALAVNEAVSEFVVHGAVVCEVVGRVHAAVSVVAANGGFVCPVGICVCDENLRQASVAGTYPFPYCPGIASADDSGDVS